MTDLVRFNIRGRSVAARRLPGSLRRECSLQDLTNGAARVPAGTGHYRLGVIPVDISGREDASSLHDLSMKRHAMWRLHER